MPFKALKHRLLCQLLDIKVLHLPFTILDLHWKSIVRNAYFIVESPTYETDYISIFPRIPRDTACAQTLIIQSYWTLYADIWLAVSLSSSVCFRYMMRNNIKKEKMNTTKDMTEILCKFACSLCYSSFCSFVRPAQNLKLIYLYLYKYENVCVFVCLSVHVLLGHFETDWETLWHKLAFCSWECSKTIIFLKMWFLKDCLPFFYISLRFLCKCDERL